MDVHFIVSFQNGCTPLHIASERNHPETVSALLQGGADVNIRDKVSITHSWFLYFGSVDCRNDVTYFDFLK